MERTRRQHFRFRDTVVSMDEQYADWEIDLYLDDMIENGVLDPDDDVLVQETREQIGEQLRSGDPSRW
jgi:hypothetical protein